MIKEVVLPGGDWALHLALLKPAISPNVGNSGAQFLVVGTAFAHPLSSISSTTSFSYISFSLLLACFLVYGFPLSLSLLLLKFSVHDMDLGFVKLFPSLSSSLISLTLLAS